MWILVKNQDRSLNVDSNDLWTKEKKSPHIPSFQQYYALLFPWNKIHNHWLFFYHRFLLIVQAIYTLWPLSLSLFLFIYYLMAKPRAESGNGSGSNLGVAILANQRVVDSLLSKALRLWRIQAKRFLFPNQIWYFFSKAVFFFVGAGGSIIRSSYLHSRAVLIYKWFFWRGYCYFLN